MENHFEYTCANCGKIGYRKNNQHPKHSIKYLKKNNKVYNWTGNHYCDKICLAKFKNKQKTLPCSWCNILVTRTNAEFLKSSSGRIFCNRSCSVSYNNTQKRKSRRSKSEKLLFDLLSAEFPTIPCIPNDKTMLDGMEVDIAFPTLNLAIEWNGIVHFKPIYGQTKLEKIQNNDQKKLFIAEQKEINLIVIPDLVSKEHYVREAFQKIKQIVQVARPE